MEKQIGFFFKEKLIYLHQKIYQNSNVFLSCMLKLAQSWAVRLTTRFAATGHMYAISVI